MTKLMTKTETAQFLLSHDRYTILSHRKPDGDTLGSSAALCLGLRALGKEAYVLRNPEISPKFSWLHEGIDCEVPADGSILISTDVAAPNMLPEAFEIYKDHVTVRIDHHGMGTSFTQYEIVDAQSASCAEIIWDLLMEMGCPVNESIAKAVYVGLSTDTGCFRFANTTAHTFRVAADCLEAGVDTFALNRTLFETNTLARMKIQSWMIENMRLFADGKYAICAIPKAVEEAIGVTSDDMDNISDVPRTVEGIKMAATLREDGNGKIKISARAVPGYDAAALCANFGGGGHKGAAGGAIHCSLEEAVQAIAAKMTEE